MDQHPKNLIKRLRTGCFMNKLLLGISFLLFLSVSCKTEKKLSNNSNYSPITANKINSVVPDYKWFQGKGKISFVSNNNQQEATLVLVIRKDSLIWGSINAAMGFEIFRFYINPCFTSFALVRMQKRK